MQGPVSSGYPGKYAWICAVIFVACLYGVEVRRFLKYRKRLSTNTPIRDKEAFLKALSGGQLAVFGVFSGFIIIVASWSIYTHWPY
jgi:hypothetical protein